MVASSAIVPAGRNLAGFLLLACPLRTPQIYLLDEQRQPVAAGETGEIYIGGAGVARGYRNQPELTAECFLPNPFSPVAGSRMYRTDDLGRLLPGGQIAFRGPADSQEKIRGHHLELDEIASALAQHPAVSSCAVAAKGAPEHGQAPKQTERRLVAYIVAREGMLSFARPNFANSFPRGFPNIWFPRRSCVMDALPLDANGKLDREALPEPTFRNQPAPSEFRAPESPVEIRIAAMLADLLNVDRIGLDDKFFLLGGHSLLGAAVDICAFGRASAVELTLRDLFEAQTLARLALKVENLWVARIESMSEEEATRILEEMERA